MVSQSKADGYLRALDDARCSSHWSQVPECARKVNKVSGYDDFAHVAVQETKLMEACKNAILQPIPENTAVATIFNDLGKELGSKRPEHNYIHHVAYAHAALLKGEFRTVVNILSTLADVKQQDYKYTLCAAVKKYTLLGYAYEQAGDSQFAVEAYRQGAKLSIGEAPETLRWAERLYSAYSDMAMESFPDDQTTALSKYHHVLGSTLGRPATKKDIQNRVAKLDKHSQVMTNKLKETPGDTDLAKSTQKLNKLYENVLYSYSHFPNAGEPSGQVENFAERLVNDWTLMTKFDGPYATVTSREQVKYSYEVLATLRKALTLTFHSCVVMRLQVRVLAALALYNEALLAFDIYRAYIERLKVREESGSIGTEESLGDSDENMVQTFTQAIKIAVEVKNDHKLAQEYADCLVEWIPDQGSDKELFARAHAALASAYELVSERQHQEEEYRKYSQLTLRHYELSVDSDSESADILVNYAIQLARAGKIADALEFVRKSLLHDKQLLSGWHLMALLLSVQEDYETAIKVVNTALAMDVELTDHTKRAKIQLKMTLIALIEAANGTEAALDKIPEVMGLFGDLFPLPPQGEEEKSEDKNADLAPIKSRRSIFKHARTPPTAQLSGKSKREKASTSSAVKKRLVYKDAQLLREIWLWIAGVYRRATLWDQSEQAIIEAESLGGANVETHTALGLLLIPERPAHAMDEFEAALDEEEDHLGAALGLAQLVLDHTTEEVPGTIKPLFISETDRLAALSRVLGLIETLSQRTPGRRKSEVFWMLSQMYELTKRDHDAQQALWRSVALEEIRPVRDYACINSVYNSRIE